jgi:hypothetical protein
MKGKKEVIAKLLSSPVYKQRLENEPETLNKFAQVLANATELKETYLTTDWVKTVKFVFYFFLKLSTVRHIVLGD